METESKDRKPITTECFTGQRTDRDGDDIKLNPMAITFKRSASDFR